MTHERAMPPDADGSPGRKEAAGFDAAIRVVGELTLALSSAISDVAFADAVRLRSELANALARATMLAALGDPTDQEAAGKQLVTMRGVASRLSEISPAPSAAAVAAANAGDRTAWDREEQAWIADRLASGTNPRISPGRRARRATQPDCPKAWRATRNVTGEAAQAALVVPLAANEDGRR